MESTPYLSVIIPFFNEEDNVRPVIEEVQNCLPDAEIVAVNDGSMDRTAEELAGCRKVRVITLSERCGQSFAIYHGIFAASGEICALLDGDGQLVPEDIPAMTEKLTTHDVVCGYRKNRNDSTGKKLGSWIANGVRRMILRDGVIDTGCSLKVFRREHRRFLIPFDGLHRFLPSFFLAGGLTLVQVPVRHRPRRTGTSKYPAGSWLGRGIRGLVDVLGVYWYLSRIRSMKPPGRSTP
jgi:dolichol-phosphate mannosyltransferase